MHKGCKWWLGLTSQVLEICSTLANRLVILSEMHIHNIILWVLVFTLIISVVTTTCLEKQKDLMHGWFPLFGFSKSHTFIFQIQGSKTEKKFQTKVFDMITSLQAKEEQILGNWDFRPNRQLCPLCTKPLNWFFRQWRSLISSVVTVNTNSLQHDKGYPKRV